MDMMQKLAAELSLAVDQVEKTVALLDEGNGFFDLVEGETHFLSQGFNNVHGYFS